MWPNESTTPSRARMRLADELFYQVVELGHRSPHILVSTVQSAQNRGNSAASSLKAGQRPSLLNFSSSPLKHIVSFARSQAMAENLVRVCTAADLPPGNVKSFEVGDERVAVYNIDGTFYATE